MAYRDSYCLGFRVKNVTANTDGMAEKWSYMGKRKEKQIQRSKCFQEAPESRIGLPLEAPVGNNNKHTYIYVVIIILLELLICSQ